LNLDNPKKILIIRFSSLGDILLTTPFLRVLKKKFPKTEIDFLIKESFIDAIRHNPNLNDVYSWGSETQLYEVVEKLKENNYDFIIDLQNNLRSKKVVRIIGTKSVSYVKPNIKKFLLVHFKLNFLKEKKSIPQRYVDVLPGLTLDDEGLQLFLPNNVISQVTHDRKVIGFAPGAFHFTKRWPIEYFAELGKLLEAEEFSIVLFGGKSDR